MLVFGKEDPNNNANYRPISLLSVILKIFERALFGHIEKFAKKKKKKILLPKFCSYRKAHSTQHAFLNLLKTW